MSSEYVVIISIDGKEIRLPPLQSKQKAMDLAQIMAGLFPNALVEIGFDGLRQMASSIADRESSMGFNFRRVGETGKAACNECGAIAFLKDMHIHYGWHQKVRTH